MRKDDSTAAFADLLQQLVTVDAVAASIARFVFECGLPTRLRDVGVPESDLAEIAEITLSDGSIVYNPKPVTDASEVMTVLRAAY